MNPRFSATCALPDFQKFTCHRVSSRVGILLSAAVLIYSPLVEGGTTHTAMMVIRMMILMSMTAYLMQGISEKVLRIPRIAVGYPIVSYLGLAGAWTLCSPYTNQSLQWMLILAGYSGFLYLLVSFLSTWECLATLVIVLSGMGLLETGFVLVQHYWNGMPRPNGTFFNPNFVAGYLGAVWLVALGCCCSVWPCRVGWLFERWSRIGVALIAGLLLSSVFLAIVLTKSRGGGLALLGGLALMMWLQFGRRGVYVVLVILILVVFVPNPWRDRFYVEYLTNPVGYARWQIWQSSIFQMMDHPLGIGLGMYQYEAPRYMFPVEGEIVRYGRVAQTAHNEYVQMAVELGIVSIGVFCWGIVAVAREVKKTFSSVLTPPQRGLLIGAVSAGVAILLHAVFDSNLHEPAIALVLVVCIAVALSAKRLSFGMTVEDHTILIRSRVAVSLISFLLVGGLAVEALALGGAWKHYDEGARAVAQEDFLHGIESYEKAVALDPGRAMYHRSIAAAYFQMFRKSHNPQAVQSALFELQQAAALNPRDSRAYERLGFLYSFLSSSQATSGSEAATRGGQRAKWLQAARGAYMRALELEPFSVFHRLELARLDVALGNSQHAVRLVQESLTIEPNFLPGRVWLARLYASQQQPNEAAREYREIKERHVRYASWPKNPVERQFLDVDIPGLETALIEAGVHI